VFNPLDTITPRGTGNKMLVHVSEGDLVCSWPISSHEYKVIACYVLPFQRPNFKEMTSDSSSLSSIRSDIDKEERTNERQ
jgi:hypothetical protein